MWPWEHVAVGYVLYSLASNLLVGDSPTGRETAAVVFGSLLPDLIDKPLAWTVGVTETGYSIAHSLFVAPFVCLVAYALVARSGDWRLAGAFSLAYLSHLVTDVLNPIRAGRSPEPRVVLWPISSPPAGDHGGFLDHVGVYMIRYANDLFAEGVSAGFVLQLSLAAMVVVVWIHDGAPLGSDCWRFVRDRLR
ncbi:metal-dependent hydrolase [Natrarchaeobius chitinivorans]|uniref:Metal-dependent hydrolase n=1 Tax=Natrarchaeobius chitinivorans TaxID=1679083 RepID=A0A3N6M4G9_NATCH|nr:metal-dependent hydrolase [Natrarchaeobius chitinivorans]RQG95384.1 metal-dependent hydrolase [Natrarchaeobius chitinivorans]